MSTLHDYRQHGVIVMDGARVVAKARRVPSDGWLLKAYGFSWVDGRKANTFGIVDPSLLIVPAKRDAIAVLRDLAA